MSDLVADVIAVTSSLNRLPCAGLIALAADSIKVSRESSIQPPTLDRLALSLGGGLHGAYHRVVGHPLGTRIDALPSAYYTRTSITDTLTFCTKDAWSSLDLAKYW
jgi:hypothetical protein